LGLVGDVLDDLKAGKISNLCPFKPLRKKCEMYKAFRGATQTRQAKEMVAKAEAAYKEIEDQAAAQIKEDTAALLSQFE
jgi:hypothetical protein